MCQVKPVQGLNISQRQWGAMVPRVRERLQATAIKVYHQIEQKRGGTHAAALHPLVEGEKKNYVCIYTCCCIAPLWEEHLLMHIH